MAEIGGLFVKIASTFDPKGMTDAKDQLGKLGGWVEKNSAQFKQLALAGAAMGTAVVYAALKAAQAAGEQEQANLMLADAMKLAGTYTEAAYKHNLDYASSLQKVSIYADEVIVGVQEMLVRFGAEGEMLDKLTKATLDLASAKKMDLGSAADLVAKAIGSSTNALARYGVTIEGTVGSTERMQMAVDNISKLFGGAAQAQAETYLGRITVLKNRWGEIVETIGFKVIPIVQELMDVVEVKVLPLLEGWMGRTKDTKGITDEFAKTLLFMARSALGVVAALDLAKSAVKMFGMTEDGRLTITKKGWTDLTDKVSKYGALLDALSVKEVATTAETGKKKEDLEAKMAERKAAREAELAERVQLVKEESGKKELEAQQKKNAELEAIDLEKAEKDIQQILDITNLTLEQQLIRLQAAQAAYAVDTEAYDLYAKAILKIEGDKTAKMMEGAQKWADAVMSGIQKVADTEKLTWKSGTKALKEALKERLRQWVLESIQEIIVHKLSALAKAIMNATITWGAAAYQIGVVLAAAAVGIAGLKAISSFDMPGIVPGPIGRPVLVQALGGERFGGRESIMTRPEPPIVITREVVVRANFYGDIRTEADIEEISNMLGRKIKNAIRGD